MTPLGVIELHRRKGQLRKGALDASFFTQRERQTRLLA